MTVRTRLLWFDVGFIRYTTNLVVTNDNTLLWFDVGFIRYTTILAMCRAAFPLWFDVGFIRYTTADVAGGLVQGCGLMWNLSNKQHVPHSQILREL